MVEKPLASRRISRRSMLATAAAVAATPAVAQECRLGPPPHHQGQPQERGEFRRRPRARLYRRPFFRRGSLRRRAYLEMAESLGNPFGPNGRAALALMRLGMG